MYVKRLQYGILLLGAAAFYLASGTWLSWILLLAALGMPWLSLLLSIPALVTFRIAPAGVETVQMGESCDLWLLGSCNFPMPPFRGRIRVTDLMTGEQWRYETEDGLDSEHCGGFRAVVEKVRVYDYMGLFSFRVRQRGEQTVIIRPKPIPVEGMLDPRHTETNRWIPKPGGGFSENHEYRPYRPGDNLNQLHWKLSAKVGQLILREPMEPVQAAAILTITLRGEPEELDRKFGRLLWLGQLLLERQREFEIQALTGSGLLKLPVDSPAVFTKALDTLLCSQLTQEDAEWEGGDAPAWIFRIGGEADEA